MAPARSVTCTRNFEILPATSDARVYHV
jgi:hypothetical protein